MLEINPITSKQVTDRLNIDCRQIHDCKNLGSKLSEILKNSAEGLGQFSAGELFPIREVTSRLDFLSSLRLKQTSLAMYALFKEDFGKEAEFTIRLFHALSLKIAEEMPDGNDFDFVGKVEADEKQKAFSTISIQLAKRTEFDASCEIFDKIHQEWRRQIVFYEAAVEKARRNENVNDVIILAKKVDKRMYPRLEGIYDAMIHCYLMNRNDSAALQVAEECDKFYENSRAYRPAVQSVLKDLEKGKYPPISQRENSSYEMSDYKNKELPYLVIEQAKKGNFEGCLSTIASLQTAWKADIVTLYQFAATEIFNTFLDSR